jgi:hypothetical protein
MFRRFRVNRDIPRANIGDNFHGDESRRPSARLSVRDCSQLVHVSRTRSTVATTTYRQRDLLRCERDASLARCAQRLRALTTGA